MWLWLYMFVRFPNLPRAVGWLAAAIIIVLLLAALSTPSTQPQLVRFPNNGAVLQIPRVMR